MIYGVQAMMYPAGGGLVWGHEGVLSEVKGSTLS